MSTRKADGIVTTFEAAQKTLEMHNLLGERLIRLGEGAVRYKDPSDDDAVIAGLLRLTVSQVRRYRQAHFGTLRSGTRDFSSSELLGRISALEDRIRTLEALFEIPAGEKK